MADKRNHRILIQVTDQEIADESLGYVMSNTQRLTKFGNNTTNSLPTRFPTYSSYADIDIVNRNTLSLSKKDNQNRTRTSELMCFDCVGRTDSDPLIRNELSSMFDMLMIEQQNCCLVQFKPLRESPTNFFNNILVPEIDRRLALLHNSLDLQSIKLEYYDVQKYDVVNMFLKARNKRKDFAKSEIVFHNTRELLRWTQHGFISLWSNGSEHDCFELEFVFVEAPSELRGVPMGNTEFKVKLSILQFYMNKVDLNMRVGLLNFFENKSQNNLRYNQSIITDYLREYFLNEHQTWLVWLLFDIPQVNYGSLLATDMLALGKAVYKGIHSGNMPNYDSESEVVFRMANEKSNLPRQVGGLNNTFPQRKLRALSTPINFNDSCVKMCNNSQSFWYCRIEKSFSSVISTMDKYYDRKYDLKVQKMCNDLKYLTRSIDKDFYTPNIGFFDERDIDADEKLKLYLKLYREALHSFRIVTQKVERSKYGDQLSTYIKMKNNDISKQMRLMKIRLLELCQNRLCNAIKDELKKLKSETSLRSFTSTSTLTAVKRI